MPQQTRFQPTVCRPACSTPSYLNNGSPRVTFLFRGSAGDAYICVMRYAFPAFGDCMRYALRMRYYAFLFGSLHVCGLRMREFKCKTIWCSGKRIGLQSWLPMFKSSWVSFSLVHSYMRNCMQTLAIAYICDMRYALMHTPVCGSPRFRVEGLG